MGSGLPGRGPVPAAPVLSPVDALERAGWRVLERAGACWSVLERAGAGRWADSGEAKGRTYCYKHPTAPQQQEMHRQITRAESFKQRRGEAHRLLTPILLQLALQKYYLRTFIKRNHEHKSVDVPINLSLPSTLKKNVVPLYQKYCENNLQNGIVVGW